MPYFKIETNMGYCGTDEEIFVEAESSEQAYDDAYADCESQISVDVQEISKEEYKENS